MEFSQNLRLAHLQLQMDTSAKYKANFHKICVLHIYNSKWTLLPSIKANRTEIVGGVVRLSIFNVNQGNNSLTLLRIFAKVASCTSTTLNEHFCQV